MTVLLGNLDLIRGHHGFSYTQSTASANWTVVHNLNSSAIASDTQIFHLGTNVKILPHAINIVDNNTISVLWSRPMTGTIRIG